MKKTKKTILITQSVKEKTRQYIDGLAAGLDNVLYLEDFDEQKRQDAFDEADIVLSLNPERELKKGEIEYLEHVEYLQLLSAGMDHLPFDLLPEKLTVAGNSGAYAIPMAEHALGMILALAKRLREEDRNMRKGEFNQMRRNTLLHGKKAAIIGFGGIGKETARLLRALNMKISAVNTSGKTDEPVDFIGTTNDLQKVLEGAAVVVLSLPLNKYTRGLIGEQELHWIEKDAILINVARGEIIDQKALYDKLLNNPDFKAGIESWWVEPFRHGKFKLDYPLLDLDNVLACPHNSSMVPELFQFGLENAFRNIQRYVNGEPLQGVLNREAFEV